MTTQKKKKKPMSTGLEYGIKSFASAQKIEMHSGGQAATCFKVTTVG